MVASKSGGASERMARLREFGHARKGARSITAQRGSWNPFRRYPLDRENGGPAWTRRDAASPWPATKRITSGKSQPGDIVVWLRPSSPPARRVRRLSRLTKNVPVCLGQTFPLRKKH